MSKGLKALQDLRTHVYAKNEDIFNRYDIIEKELKQAQKDKEMLNIFKNALTIEHDLSPSLKPLDEACDVSVIITETFKIIQKKLDEKLRKTLREWVLENAFPEEFKAIKIIKNNDIIATLDFIQRIAQNKEEYYFLKETLL